MISNCYDAGSVVPRFHGDGHKLKLAFMVVIEGEDEMNLPEPIEKLVHIYLMRTGAALDADNAPDFVLNFRKEAFARYELRRLTEPDNKTECDPLEKPHPESPIDDGQE